MRAHVGLWYVCTARLTPSCLFSLPSPHKPIHPHYSSIKQLCIGPAMTVSVRHVGIFVCTGGCGCKVDVATKTSSSLSSIYSMFPWFQPLIASAFFLFQNLLSSHCTDPRWTFNNIKTCSGAGNLVLEDSTIICCTFNAFPNTLYLLQGLDHSTVKNCPLSHGLLWGVWTCWCKQILSPDLLFNIEEKKYLKCNALCH